MSHPAARGADVHNAERISAAAKEVRYPLVPIRNALAMLRGIASDQDAVRRATDIIEREVVNVDRLIGDLVDVSRIQLGALELRCKRAPLSELMERGMSMLGQLATDHGLHSSVSLSSEPVYLHMDVPRLCQALHNLVVNTCRYSHPSGHIHVCASREGSNVSIVIGDTLKGIPAAQRQSLGNQFLRSEQQDLVEASLSLGLYLARHFVEAHDGNVTAVSRDEHRGNGFRIELPCEASTALVPGPVSETSAADRFPA